MLPLIFIVIVSINVFKQARSNGRSPYLWTAAGVAIFYGIQITIGVVLGLIVFFTAGVDGADTVFVDSALLINLVSLVVSGAAAMGLLWFVSRMPAEPYPSAPPNPSFFGLDD